MTTTTPDAVEALVHSCEKYNYGKSASKEPRGESIIMADIIEKHLASQGFTITRSHSHKFADDMMSAGVKFDPSPDWNATVTITRAEPAPVGFDAAIKQLGEPDEATGHWSLDEGNLRWFVGQCRAKPAMSEAELELDAKQLAIDCLGQGHFAVEQLKDEAMELAKKYRGQS